MSEQSPIDQLSFLPPEDAQMVQMLRRFLAEASRIYETRRGMSLENPVTITAPGDVYELLRLEMAALEQEQLRVLTLTTKNRVLSAPVVYQGTLNTTPGAIVKCCGSGRDQAAASLAESSVGGGSGGDEHRGEGSTRTPSLKVTPARRAATRWGALTRRQRVSAAWMSLKAMASPALRDPAPRVRLVRALTVPKPDSMGLVVRR